MARQTYIEIAQRLAVLERKLSEAGFKRPDRIRYHIKNITDLAEAQKAGTLRQIAAQADGKQRRELMWSLVEGLELLDAFNGLGSYSIPPGVLERALRGPVEPSLESDRNNLGRNTTFEIVTPGDLASVGLEVTLGLEPDVIATFENRRLLIACKRALSENTVAGQIKTAAQQLGQRFQRESEPRDCGIIAISVTRAFTTGNKLLNSASFDDIDPYLDKELHKLAYQNERTWRAIKSPKISAILLHIATPAFVEKEQLLISATQRLLIRLPGKPDWPLLDRLGALLKLKATIRAT